MSNGFVRFLYRTISCISPLRKLKDSMTLPMYSSGVSVCTRSNGSHFTPSISFFNNFWTRYLQFVSFTTHVFNQDRQMQFSTTRNSPSISESLLVQLVKIHLFEVLPSNVLQFYEQLHIYLLDRQMVNY